MSRKTVLCLTLAAGLIALPLSGGERAPRGERQQIEALIADLETLLGRLHGDPEPIVRKRGKGLVSMTFPLSSSVRERIAASAPGPPRKSRNFKAMATGISLKRVFGVNKLQTSMLPTIVNVPKKPKFWFCAVNTGEVDLFRRTTHTLTGPKGRKVFNLGKRRFEYPENAVQCYIRDLPGGVNTVGNHEHSVTIQGGGTATSRFFAV